MDKFCPKCKRKTLNNTCVVHGKVDAKENTLLTKIYKAIYSALKNYNQTEYAKEEIISKAVSDISKEIEEV